MEIRVKKGDVLEEKCEVLVIGAFEADKDPKGVISAVDLAVDGWLLKHMKQDCFKAKPGATYLSRAFPQIPAKRVLVVGLGKKKDLTSEIVRAASGSVLNAIKSLKVKTVVMDLVGLDQEIASHDCAQAIVEGFMLANYEFIEYKKSKGKAPASILLVTSDGRAVRSADRGVEDGRIASVGTMLARDLVNTPGRDMCPDKLVEEGRKIAQGKSEIKIKVFDKEKLERMGAGGILGVGQGSEKPVYMVHMTYKPKKATRKKVCLVGKAVTFDSGGLSLKPSKSMTSMKADMAGSAAVLGLFSVIDQIAPKCEVHGIFAPVENMPSGSAIRPDDVLRMMNKKTVEVLNTDAEGRLTLADMLVYAEKQKPDMIVDLATLTGACVVALGEEISAVMSDDEKLPAKILESAKTAGEKMWQLPLEKNYAALIKSDIADVKNLGNGWGGAITAGLFLSNFVEKTPWAHIDIAGPGFADRPHNSYTKKGATGHGVRTLIELLKNV